ncbi:RNA-directed DNA polymerase from mobile element jockey [Eumeta japonica]|uniref:RNA-directed DNA polymerase from mobile element jockey n=1 Tax=Eumeta variegata TaxID=151549 RepID=A0A4C1VC34_EUMVA|nr:RNA-directed DNA polymerase from mobile element jockey [Eumeta japonica]
MDRQVAPKEETALYYRRTLSCYSLDISPLINLEATGCRLSMTGHGTIIIISEYLPPRKEFLRSDIETLLSLGHAVILFGDLNSKSTFLRCNYTNANGGEMLELAEDLHFDFISPPKPTYFPYNMKRRFDILCITFMRGVALEMHRDTSESQFSSPPLPLEVKASRRRAAS